MYDLDILISRAVINVIVSLHLFPCTKDGTRLNVYTYNRTPFCGYGMYAHANFMGMRPFLRVIENIGMMVYTHKISDVPQSSIFILGI